MVVFLLSSVFLEPSLAFTDENLDLITIEEWHMEDEAGKYHFCNSLNYEFYINKIFTQEIITEIDDNTKRSFDELGKACFAILLNSNQENAKFLKYNAKSFIYKTYKQFEIIEAKSITLNTSVVNNMTIEKWLSLNSDDKGKSCAILNKSFYRNNIFNSDVISEIKLRPETTFYAMNRTCINALKNYEKSQISVSKIDLIKDYLLQLYEIAGFTKSIYLWDD